MHKARENANGTFSIGKTWMLDDLSAIRSYSGSTPANAEEEQQKEWAGGVGFTVTIGKPYYWQANTQKEKQFFIASLTKIYTKYTGGRAPELIGFDATEREQLLGGSRRPQQPHSQQPGGSSYGQPQNRPPRREPSREQMLRTQPSRDAMQRTRDQMPSSATSSFTSQTARPNMRNRGDSPSGSIDSNPNGPQQSQPALRRLAGTNQSQESIGRSDDGGSRPPRSRGGPNTPNGSGRFQNPNLTPTSQRTPEGSFTSKTGNDIPPVPAPLALPPERRRPPMPILGDSRSRGQNSMENMVPAPLSSPGMRRDDLRPPTRSSERSVPREDTNGGGTSLYSNGSGLKTPDIPRKKSDETDRSEPPSKSINTTGTISSDSLGTSPAVQMPPEPAEEERPGLGPMIKKKSKGDVAGTFLRAAKTVNALNTFKPRAGGAAERLRENQVKVSSDGPDGITGVVPAPSLIRGTSTDSGLPLSASSSLDKNSPQKMNNSIPEVKITVPTSGQSNGARASTSPPQGTLSIEKAKPREAKKSKPPSETMAKELESIGIDPSVLGGRGGELVSAWEEFGWVGEGIRTKNIDQMNEEVERELNRIQAGGWLNRLEEEDDRIEGIKQGLDKCIDECDELDGLLTLYLVELSVGQISTSRKRTNRFRH